MKQKTEKEKSEEFKKALDKFEKKQLKELHVLADYYGYKLIKTEKLKNAKNDK